MTNEQLAQAIKELKLEKNAVILAHYYQRPEIQDIADFIGDSLALSQEAIGTSADLIVFAGVLFMAETAKILNPKRKVVLPTLAAGCSLADNCPADQFKRFVDLNPDHTVITYINCSVGVKALSDICVTSSNAERILRSLPPDEKIIFAPDRHLGHFLSKKTGRALKLWHASCEVHEKFDLKGIAQLKAQHPEAKVLAHPECPEDVLTLSDHIGSTSALLGFAERDSAREFIVVTEAGILHQMQKTCPTKSFFPAPLIDGSECALCPHMRLNTLESILECMKQESPEIKLEEQLRLRALAPIERMLAMS